MEIHERDYTTVSIPKDVVEKASRILSREGYQSFAEFVRDAVRRRLEELEKKSRGRSA